MNGGMAKEGDDNALLSAFGARVRTARHQIGVSQEELAARAGLDRTYVSGIERGRRNLSLINLCRLATALGVDPSHLVDGLAYEGRYSLV